MGGGARLSPGGRRSLAVGFGLLLLVGLSVPFWPDRERRLEGRLHDATREALSALASGDVERLASRLAQDVSVDWNGARLAGRDAAAAAWRELRAGMHHLSLSRFEVDVDRARLRAAAKGWPSISRTAGHTHVFPAEVDLRFVESGDELLVAHARVRGTFPKPDAR